LDADRFLATVESAKLRGDWTDPSAGRVTLYDWSSAWLLTVVSTLKPKTIASYESLLRSRILPVLGSRTLASLRPSDVEAWIGQMQVDGLSPSRIRQAHVVLKLTLDGAVRDGRIPRNVAHGARLPRVRRSEATFFEAHVVDAIINQAPDEYACFLAAQGILGLRFGEAAALRRRSVNLLRRRLRVGESLAELGGELVFGSTKTHAARSVPIPSPLADRLARHMESVGPDPGALLFTSTRGLPLRYSRFRPTVWLPILDRLNLPRTGMHSLRHSAAARMISADWNPKAVQQVMGHSSVAFTLTVYGHLFEDDLDALGEALVAGSRGFPAEFGTRRESQVRT
jgi:integrase